MPVYQDTQQLYSSLRSLFERIKSQDGVATGPLTTSKLIIRLRCTQPEAEVTISGRQKPLRIDYGASPLRPDLDVSLSADTLHAILLAELPLGKAIANREMKVRGPLMKAFVLEEILHLGQALYPQVLAEQGLDGHRR